MSRMICQRGELRVKGDGGDKERMKSKQEETKSLCYIFRKQYAKVDNILETSG